jgi:hypothetical protein
MKVCSQDPPPNKTTCLSEISVIEWDSKMHVEAYELWLEAVLADGGEGCKELCLLANEPLVEGMLVGKAENFLSPKGRRDVSSKYSDDKNGGN